MNVYGVEVAIKNVPVLDKEFVPIGKFNEAFLKTATKPVGIAVERNDGQTAVYTTYIHGTADKKQADTYYIDRLCKTVLWMKGGYKIYVSGDKAVYEYLKQTYARDGARAFDVEVMELVYEKGFVVEYCEQLPKQNESAQPVGRHLDGCRIGFDAGGSDRKVSAVIDGKSVYSEEVVWSPKTTTDPSYHYNEILSALRTAAAHMPRVDAIGVSSAGIQISNHTMHASLFMSVPREQWDEHVKDMYIRAARQVGVEKVAVANDGDVTALAGAMSLNANNILGIAMGTAEAAGYVDSSGNIAGWINELAFVPVDVSPDAMMDEWAGDIGCGVKYFSQDGVIKLAQNGGLVFCDCHTPAEKLKMVQKMLLDGSKLAENVYTSIGVYLGHTLAFYHELYGFEHVLLLGRVMSGRGGDIIIETANEVLDDEYASVAKQIALSLPDEKFRRVGQSVAAASLPKI
ncbi:MAG: ROK family protein [Clostridia bacterium]|jgi:predicted NBD/HSP70 family sugar kinase|nr:ROK family protein [Clostridia bacterium]